MDPIKIIVEEDGIYHKLERAGAKDDVQWTCEHPFTVDFGVETPLVEGQRVSGELQSDGTYLSPIREVDAAETKKGAPVKFKYTISVFVPADDGAGHVDLAKSKVLIEDPEIIIDP
jgi:hypothetical protein